jgi:hypothetical protein
MVLALLLLLGTARVARAECHPASGGHLHGGGSGTRDVSPRHEFSEVVGHHYCRRFGDWNAADRLPLVLAVGLAAYTLAAPAGRSGGADDLTVAALTVRSELRLTGGWFLGLEGRVGVPTSGQSSGTADHASDYLAGAGVAGALLPLGRFALRGELLAGAAALSVLSQTGCSCGTSMRALLEPRVGGELWLGPASSIAVIGGADLLRSAAPLATVVFNWHRRGYDGRGF